MPGQLEYPFNCEWTSIHGVSVIGRAHHAGKLLDGGDLAQIFSRVASEKSFQSALLALNGCFAVVLSKPSFQAAAVDHIRSMPILYRYTESGFEIITDQSWKPDYNLNQYAADIFIDSWCVQGNDTLVDGIHQLSAGQYIWWEGDVEVKPTTYYEHFKPKFTGDSRVELEKRAKHVFHEAFERTLKEIGSRPVLVPLSGGYDSRLILSMLVRAGRKNIVAYTYGNPESHEVKIAREVSRQLHVKWHFIEYDKKLFEAFFTESWKSYSEKNHFFSSLPHEQDFFALKQLSDKGLLPADFVAIPGFCGDALGGSITAYRPSDWSATGLRKMISEKILKCSLEAVDLEGMPAIIDKNSFYNAYQQWFMNNKVSKFIVNAVRVFEHFGGSWTMPFWDKELADFWYAVPYKLREKQSLYNEVLFTEYFEPMNIGIRKPGHDDNYPGRVSEKIKKHLPDPMKKLFQNLKSNPVRDPNRLGTLNRLIIENMNEPFDSDDNEVNRSHARYFLRNLTK
ncbi:MAG: hypothetical protein GY751_06965 [Bacteroidetes bacterium]|nr:hypothetical protein [Bacteroidota bacterium]